MKPCIPSIDSISFSCAHCGAHADQTWYELGAKELEDHGTPFRFDLSILAEWKASPKEKSENLTRTFTALATRISDGEVFFPKLEGDEGAFYQDRTANLFLSRCYSCGRLSVWVSTKIVYPTIVSAGTPPNDDLPAEVKADYNEARAIVDLSPRGAAALLRLCIQKLCKHLGEPGENLNDDIAGLVKKGLARRVQQALDIVRVIGNESVHPGQIDLRDDPATASRLFELVNLIAEKMITEPKHIDAMFNSLPEGKRRAVEARDKPKP